MAESGMAMMVKSLIGAVGIDPEGLKRDIEQFMAMMKAGVDQLNANQARIDAKLDRIEKLVAQPGETVAVLDDLGNATGVLLTTEKFPDAMLEDVKYTNGGSYAERPA
jgi:hypothetical protein